MRVFVFGIGGTGSRVLRSLTMLLAAGVKLEHQDISIVPVIIDTDAHNGDTARTRELLRAYHTIRNTFVDRMANSRSEIFFNNQIRSFTRADADGHDSAELDVQLNFQNQENTFANFINHSGLSDDNKDIIELLYNDSVDEYPELHLDLTVGFKGNPNIGSVVFNGLADARQFKNFEGSFTANDRVFVISSIFGGTGASGFPTLIKLIRNSKNEHLKKSLIGAITIMPYFNVDSDDKSAINSAIFDTKTKAALSFYAEDAHVNSVNALYYLADDNQSGSLPNVEGGKNQLNDAHVIELIGATAVLDFINKKNEELATAQCYEFGAESGENPFTIAHLSLATKEKYIKPLVAFAYAAKIATDFIPRLNTQAFYAPQELNIAGELGLPNQYQKLLWFFGEFKKWAGKEMLSPGNGRRFTSFNFDEHENLNLLVQGKVIKTSFFNSGLTLRDIGKRITGHQARLPKDMPVAHKYMQSIYKTAQDCVTELGQLP